MTTLATDAIRFVKELYPRIDPDDAAIWSAMSANPWRGWIVAPCPPQGWSVTMLALDGPGKGRKSVTHGGFKPEAVTLVLQEWGLTEPVAWERSTASEPGPAVEMVYAIRSAAGGLVKIGRSNDVARRLADIQRMSPVPLAVLWQTPGGADLEASLHRVFASRRVYGEWFDFGSADPVATISQEIPA